MDEDEDSSSQSRGTLSNSCNPGTHLEADAVSIISERVIKGSGYSEHLVTNWGEDGSVASFFELELSLRE